MGPVRVLCRSPKGVAVPESCVYLVCEDKGVLIWVYSDSADYPSHEPKVLPRCGQMTQTPVTPEDAMIVTGIDHPMAAMDRLREMVYEGGGSQ